MAQIESKHDVRRKVRDAQAQVNRARLQRESDDREDVVAFLVAEKKLSAVSEWEAERHAQVQTEAVRRGRRTASPISSLQGRTVARGDANLAFAITVLKSWCRLRFSTPRRLSQPNIPMASPTSSHIHCHTTPCPYTGREHLFERCAIPSAYVGHVKCELPRGSSHR